MNMYIVSEPLFENTEWYREILSGIDSSANRKLLNPVFLDYRKFSDYFEKIKNDTNTVLILGTSYAWIISVLRLVNQKSIYPMLISAGNITFPAPHSIITQSYSQSTFYLYNRFKDMGCKSIAFFGMNYDAGSDRMKLAGYTAALDDNERKTQDKRIFVNNISASKAAEKFIKQKENFDAVICTNDYIAVLLIKKLRAEFKSDKIPYKIASFGKTIVLREFYPEIIRVTLDFFEAGVKTADLYRYIVQNNSIISMTVTVKNKILIGGNEFKSKDERELKKYLPDLKNEKFEFYADKEIMEINALEKLLRNMNDLDRDIFKALSKGFTYEKTAEICNTGVTTVKYRLNRLRELCGFGKNKSMTEIFKEYIPQRRTDYEQQD